MEGATILPRNIEQNEPTQAKHGAHVVHFAIFCQSLLARGGKEKTPKRCSAQTRTKAVSVLDVGCIVLAVSSDHRKLK